jgi:nucleoside-diphosphate-sugar epimerase
VKDAAGLYRLAIEQAPGGAVLNAVGDEGMPVREIAEAIGRNLNLPAHSLPAEEFSGMLVPLLSRDMPASSTITRELLGWKPAHPASPRRHRTGPLLHLTSPRSGSGE